MAGLRHFRPLGCMALLLAACLLLALPAARFAAWIKARAAGYRAAEHEIRALMGGELSVVGPFLRVPVTGGATGHDWRPPLLVYPDELVIEIRQRQRAAEAGAYRIPYVAADIAIAAWFGPPDAAPHLAADETAQWSRADLVLRLPGSTSFRTPPVIAHDGRTFRLPRAASRDGNELAHRPGAPPRGWISLSMEMTGAAGLHVAPLGAVTTLRVASDRRWRSPAFTPDPVALTRGFGAVTAEWTVTGGDRPTAAPARGRHPEDISETSGRGRQGPRRAISITYARDPAPFAPVARLVRLSPLLAGATLLLLFAAEAVAGAPGRTRTRVAALAVQAAAVALLYPAALRLGAETASLVALAAASGGLALLWRAALPRAWPVLVVAAAAPWCLAWDTSAFAGRFALLGLLALAGLVLSRAVAIAIARRRASA